MVLSITNLQGFGGPPSPNPVATSFSYIATTTSVGTTSSVSFTSQSLGVADTNRVIAVVVYSDGQGSGGTISSSTIAGVSGSTLAEVANSTCACAVIAASVPTGTTGTISLTFSNNQTAIGISVYRLVGYSVTALDFDTDNVPNADEVFSTVNIDADGVVVSGAIFDQADGGASSWTDATEQSDQDMDSASITSATVSGIGAQTNFVFSALTSKGNVSATMASASFEPMV